MDLRTSEPATLQYLDLDTRALWTLETTAHQITDPTEQKRPDPSVTVS